MTPILIIIGLILLFKFVLTSHAASNVVTKTSVVNTADSCGSAGDNFTSGKGIVAGVSEPSCNMIRVGVITSGRMPAPMPVYHPPLHVTYPIAPPPIRIQTPILPRVNTAAPIIRPSASFVRNTPCYGGRVFGSSCGAVFECGGRLLQEP